MHRIIQLSAMRHYLLGEEGHRLPNHGMVHNAALIEIADELVHPVLALEGAHPLDAKIGIAEDPHLALYVLVANPLYACEDLPERLEAAEVGLADRPQPLGGFAQKAEQSGLGILPRLGTARRNMHRECQRGVPLRV